MDINSLINTSVGFVKNTRSLLVTHVAKPTLKAIESHPGVAAIVGTVATGCVVADDIHQRKQTNMLLNDQKKTIEALKKHEAQIQSLEKDAEKAKELEEVNEQLANALKERIS